MDHGMVGRALPPRADVAQVSTSVASNAEGAEVLSAFARYRLLSILERLNGMPSQMNSVKGPDKEPMKPIGACLANAINNLNTVGDQLNEIERILFG